MTALLRFDGIALRRGGRLLFEDLDLAIGTGEALQVVGPNGSGKSSLIRLAAGLLRQERGRVERSPSALADDQPALDRELPLGRALSFWGGPPEPALEALGISHLAGVPVRLLSSGQLKRATLARAAASGAPLWLVDEPLNALDSDGAERLAKLLTDHRAAGGAVLAASHQPLAGDWARLELGE
jgi:heme exporter protein A